VKFIASRIARAAVVLVAAAGALVLASTAAGAAPKPAPPEQVADAPVSVQGDCSPVVGCSQIHNDSSTYIIIRPNWTCSSGTTGSTAGIGCTSGTSTYLYAGQHTPTDQDWDTFRVDPGWCYKVKFYLPFKSWTVKYNRTGLGEIWVKVEDWATAVIQAQQYGSCPA
jgi:hypothetical protein